MGGYEEYHVPAGTNRGKKRKIGQAVQDRRRTRDTYGAVITKKDIEACDLDVLAQQLQF